MRDIGMTAAPSAIPANTFLVYGDTRCISGDAFIGYQVRTQANELQNSKGGSLARLFHRFHGKKFPGSGSYQRNQTIDSTFWVPTMMEDGRIFQNKIINVIDSGERECVRIRTVGGIELICTPDHPIAESDTAFGFTLAAELKIGAQILTHKHVWWTPEIEAQPRVNRPEIFVKHHPTASTKVVHDLKTGKDYNYKRVRRSRAVYEANMNGLRLEDFVARLNENRLEGLLFLTSDVHIHHKDENKLNDVPENLLAMSNSEHSREHFVLPNGKPRCGSYIAVHDVVSSIESIGKHHTYDIKVTGPYHNFVADGFIVHNSGKSEFGATFPRPLIIADVAERGYETIQTMDRAKWWEPDVDPIIKGIDNIGDLAQIVAFAQPLIQSGRILSVVFDAFTFYADFYLAKLIEMNPGMDNRQVYGKLATHLQWVRNLLHQLPVNIVWSCLAAAPEAGAEGQPAKAGLPMIPGSQGPKFAAGVSYLMYSRVIQKREGGKVTGETFELRTKQFNQFAAGNRLGLNVLPDPFIMGSYSDLAPHLGLDIEAMKGAMKPITGAVPAVRAPTPIARPPIQRPAVARR